MIYKYVPCEGLINAMLLLELGVEGGVDLREAALAAHSFVQAVENGTPVADFANALIAQIKANEIINNARDYG